MMKIKEGFVKREIMNQIVAVPTGPAAQDFHGMIKLNKTASYIWDCFLEGMNIEQTTDALMAQYDVGRDEASADVCSLAEQLKQVGFVE